MMKKQAHNSKRRLGVFYDDFLKTKRQTHNSKGRLGVFYDDFLKTKKRNTGWMWGLLWWRGGDWNGRSRWLYSGNTTIFSFLFFFLFYVKFCLYSGNTTICSSFFLFLRQVLLILMKTRRILLKRVEIWGRLFLLKISTWNALFQPRNASTPIHVIHIAFLT